MPSVHVGGVLRCEYKSGPPTTMRKKRMTPMAYMVRRRDAHDMRLLYLRFRTTKNTLAGVFCVESSVLATSYSRLSTTIASTGLNCRVRKENGCCPSDKSPERSFQRPIFLSGTPLRNNGSPLAGRAHFIYEKPASPDIESRRATHQRILSVLLFDTRLPQFLSGVLSGY